MPQRTLYALPVGEDHAPMEPLLTLSHVLGTGHHAAVVAASSPETPWPSWVTAPWGSAG